jgi:hypothetical protein
MEANLSTKMLQRADEDALPAEHELRQAAQEFETACSNYFAEPQTCSVKRFLGVWARTNRLWGEYRKGPLI